VNESLVKRYSTKEDRVNKQTNKHLEYLKQIHMG